MDKEKGKVNYMKQFLQKTKSGYLAIFLVIVLMVTCIVPNNLIFAKTNGKVKSVTVTNVKNKELKLTVGQTKKLKVKVKTKGKISKKVTYKTSNKKVATVSKAGKLTAKKKGTAKITVTAKANKKKKVVIKVTVVAKKKPVLTQITQEETSHTEETTTKVEETTKIEETTTAKEENGTNEEETTTTTDDLVNNDLETKDLLNWITSTVDNTGITISKCGKENSYKSLGAYAITLSQGCGQWPCARFYGPSGMWDMSEAHALQLNVKLNDHIKGLSIKLIYVDDEGEWKVTRWDRTFTLTDLGDGWYIGKVSLSEFDKYDASLGKLSKNDLSRIIGFEIYPAIGQTEIESDTTIYIDNMVINDDMLSQVVSATSNEPKIKVEEDKENVNLGESCCYSIEIPENVTGYPYISLVGPNTYWDMSGYETLQMSIKINGEVDNLSIKLQYIDDEGEWRVTRWDRPLNLIKTDDEWYKGEVQLAEFDKYDTSLGKLSQDELSRIRTIYIYALLGDEVTTGNTKIHIKNMKTPSVRATALFVGDSISEAGCDEAKKRGWAGRVAELCNISSVNAAVGGASVSTIRPDNRIITQLETYSSKEFDYVILHGGVNDAMSGAEVGQVSDINKKDGFDNSTFAGALEEMFSYAKKHFPNAKMGYIINYATPNSTWGGNTKDMSEYFDEAKKICDKWEIPYLNLYSGTVNVDGQELSYSYDILKVSTGDNFNNKDVGEVHIGASGYDLISPYIGRWINSL